MSKRALLEKNLLALKRERRELNEARFDPKSLVVRKWEPHEEERFRALDDQVQGHEDLLCQMRADVEGQLGDEPVDSDPVNPRSNDQGTSRISDPNQFRGQSPAIVTKKHRWSYFRAMDRVFDHKVVDGLESEVTQQVRRAGKTTSRSYGGAFTIPSGYDPEVHELMYPGSVERNREYWELRTAGYLGAYRRDLTTTTGTGGIFTVPELPMIELLRAKMVLQQLGVTHIPNCQGLFAIPQQTGKVTVNWMASESSTSSTSNATIGQVAFSPKLAIAITNVSRQFINQTSVSAETFALNDLAESMAVEGDRVGINGTGTGIPTGILQNSTIQTNSSGAALGTSGGVLSYGALINLETQIANLNAEQGTLAYLTNPSVRGTLKQTYLGVQAQTTYPLFVWEGSSPDGTGTINGYKAMVSTNVPSNLTKGSGTALSAIICGYFPALIWATWDDGIDFLVNPYTNQSSAAVLISMQMSMDYEVRHVENFAIISDAVTDAF